jgi:hypothetical protein
MQLFARNLRKILRILKHRLITLLKEEKLGGIEFIHRSLEGGEVHLCELDQGSFLDEKDEEEEKHVDILMNYLESLDRQEDVLKQEPNEAK